MTFRSTLVVVMLAGSAMADDLKSGPQPGEQTGGFSTLFVILFEDYRSAATRSELAWYEALKGQ